MITTENKWRLKLTDNETGIVTEMDLVLNVGKPVTLIKVMYDLLKDFNIEVIDCIE